MTCLNIKKKQEAYVFLYIIIYAYLLKKLQDISREFWNGLQYHQNYQ
jgi:hypothetical protein